MASGREGLLTGLHRPRQRRQLGGDLAQPSAGSFGPGPRLLELGTPQRQRALQLCRSRQAPTTSRVDEAATRSSATVSSRWSGSTRDRAAATAASARLRAASLWANVRTAPATGRA